jgi:hypothetical protein
VREDPLYTTKTKCAFKKAVSPRVLSCPPDADSRRQKDLFEQSGSESKMHAQYFRFRLMGGDFSLLRSSK